MALATRRVARERMRTILAVVQRYEVFEDCGVRQIGDQSCVDGEEAGITVQKLGGDP